MLLYEHIRKNNFIDNSKYITVGDNIYCTTSHPRTKAKFKEIKFSIEQVEIHEQTDGLTLQTLLICRKQYRLAKKP